MAGHMPHAMLPALGLPARLSDWSDEHALRALLAYGHDVVGNLLLGDLARDRFLSTPLPVPVAQQDKAVAYSQLALNAASGEVPGSSAGGEQPKFAVYAETPAGPRHLLVKFSEAENSPVSERWRDLLLAEHLALETLRGAGISAAQTYIFDHDGQRFLESKDLTVWAVWGGVHYTGYLHWMRICGLRHR